MNNIVGAKKVEDEPVKPIDEQPKGLCPCNSFLKCSTRPPYGQQVWSDPDERKIACGEIAYDHLNILKDKTRLNEIFEIIVGRMKDPRGNKNYKNIDTQKTRVMYFPPITEARLVAELGAMSGKLSNAGKFRAFQKSMILRANIVKNGMVLKSDVYLDKDGKVEFGKQKLTPYSKKPIGTEWNIDHIQARSKGGCNRFCNAALLGSADNKSKLDEGLGCPCVEAIDKKGNKGKNQTDFSFSGSKVKKYKLYNCRILCNKIKRNEKKKIYDLPAKPLGTMNHYVELCMLDNPMDFIPDRSVSMMDKANKICKDGS